MADPISSSAVYSIAASGLRAQQSRMRIIAENLANADSTAKTPNGDPYRRQTPVFQPTKVDGGGLARLRDAGIEVTVGIGAEAAERSMAGFLTRQRLGRPFVTLKLAMSIDGKIALSSGESRWITGDEARAHAHGERARADMILIGRGTWEADRPKLDVRLPGLEHLSPRRGLLTRGPPVEGWTRFSSPEEIFTLADVNDLLIEGGSAAASAFLLADLVDRMLIYRAPVLIGEGKPSVGDVGLAALADAHGRWRLAETRPLGIDRLEVYERLRSAEA